MTERGETSIERNVGSMPSHLGQVMVNHWGPRDRAMAPGGLRYIEMPSRGKMVVRGRRGAPHAAGWWCDFAEGGAWQDGRTEDDSKLARGHSLRCME